MYICGEFIITGFSFLCFFFYAFLRKIVEIFSHTPTFIKRDYGGAYKCYKYAQELGVPIMNIADNIKNQEL